MKKSSIRYIVILNLFILSLISCKNVFNGNEFITELNDTIEYINKPYVSVTISANSEITKYISPVANIYEEKYKLNDIIDLSFMETNEYLFLSWIAEPEDSVEFIKEDEKTQNPEQSRIAKVKIISSENPITLRPKVIQRPEIVFNSPVYTFEGVYRDANIQVIFNTNMDENSIYYTEQEIIDLSNKNENIEFLSSATDENKKYGYVLSDGNKIYKNIEITGKNSENLLSYYSEPYFEDGKTLVIPTKLADEAPIAGTKINVSINNFFATDEETKLQVFLSSKYQWFYYVNRNMDSIAPSIPKDFYLNVYGLNNENTSRELSFNVSPENPQICSYTKEDLYSMYLLDSKIDINAKIYDDGSGIDPTIGFCVKLQQIYDSNYTYKNNAEEETIYFTGTINGSIAEYKTSFNFKSEQKIYEDGIYKISFYAKDKNGNTSQSLKTLYILLDQTPTKAVADVTSNYYLSQENFQLNWNNPANFDLDYITVTISSESNGNISIIEKDKMFSKTETSYSLNGIKPNKKYIITFIAFDLIGNATDEKTVAINLTDKNILNRIELDSYHLSAKASNKKVCATVFFDNNAYTPESNYKLKLIRRDTGETKAEVHLPVTAEGLTFSNEINIPNLDTVDDIIYDIRLFANGVEVTDSNGKSAGTRVYVSKDKNSKSCDFLNATKVELSILPLNYYLLNEIDKKNYIELEFNSDFKRCLELEETTIKITNRNTNKIVYDELVDISEIKWTHDQGEILDDTPFITRIPLPEEPGEYSMTIKGYNIIKGFYVGDKPHFSSFIAPTYYINNKIGNHIVEFTVTGTNFALIGKEIPLDEVLTCKTIPNIKDYCSAKKIQINYNEKIVFQFNFKNKNKEAAELPVGTHTVTFKYGDEELSTIFRVINIRDEWNIGDIVMSDGTRIPYDETKTELTAQETKNGTVKPMGIYFMDDNSTGQIKLLGILKDEERTHETLNDVPSDYKNDLQLPENITEKWYMPLEEEMDTIKEKINIISKSMKRAGGGTIYDETQTGTDLWKYWYIDNPGIEFANGEVVNREIKVYNLADKSFEDYTNQSKYKCLVIANYNM